MIDAADSGVGFLSASLRRCERAASRPALYSLIRLAVISAREVSAPNADFRCSRIR